MNIVRKLKDKIFSKKASSPAPTRRDREHERYLDELPPLETSEYQLPKSIASLEKADISRTREKAKLEELYSQDSEECYLVEAEWMNSWQKYLKGASPPGPIKTLNLQDKYGEISSGIKLGEHYRILNPSQWHFLECIHGAEKPLVTKSKSPGTFHRRSKSLTKPALSTSRMDNLQPRQEKLPTFKNEVTLMDEAMFSDQESINKCSTKTSEHCSSGNNQFVKKKGKVGLENPGFFCYMNSGLQCILSAEGLQQFFIENQFPSGKFPVSFLASKLFTSVFELNSGRLRPVSFWNYISKHFDSTKEHDLPEFLRFFINAIDTELNNCLSKRYFNGEFLSTFTCVSCKNTTSSTEAFIDLQLTLTHSLSKSLKAYTKSEFLSFFCENCEKSTKAVKNTHFKTTPEYLVIQLKRFEHSSKAKKIDAYCRFHKKLELGELSEEAPQYELISCAVHLGSINSGHYTTYSKRAHKWYLFNDESVIRSSLKEVLAQKAYLLIYQKCNTKNYHV